MQERRRAAILQRKQPQDDQSLPGVVIEEVDRAGAAGLNYDGIIEKGGW